MLINKTIYTLGDIQIDKVVSLMQSGNCRWEYFVYTTSGLPVIGNFQAMKREKAEVIILGIATSGRLAQKLVLHIIMKALELDFDIISGIKKMTDI